MKRHVWNRLLTAVFIILGHALFYPGPAAAQDQDAGNVFHWAYAPAFGTGAYRIEGEETVVISFKPKIQVRQQVEKKIGIKLSLPLSFGLQTLKLDDIFEEDLPEQFTTASFVPGVEFDIPIGRRWQVRPFGNIGWGASFRAEESAWIYFGGAKSRFQHDLGNARLGFLAELLWSGYSPTPGKEDDFSRYMLGLEVDYPLGTLKFRNQQLLIRPHLLYYRYFNDLEFLVPNEGDRILSLDEEVEVAVALGTEKYQNFWLFKPDRIGIGLRLSQDLVGIRIFLLSVFD
jgi:hypothetical protein